MTSEKKERGKFRSWMKNVNEDGETVYFGGRNFNQWWKISLFYFSLYVFLALFFFAHIKVLMEILNERPSNLKLCNTTDPNGCGPGPRRNFVNRATLSMYPSEFKFGSGDKREPKGYLYDYVQKQINESPQARPLIPVFKDGMMQLTADEIVNADFFGSDSSMDFDHLSDNKEIFCIYEKMKEGPLLRPCRENRGGISMAEFYKRSVVSQIKFDKDLTDKLYEKVNGEANAYFKTLPHQDNTKNTEVQQRTQTLLLEVVNYLLAAKKQAENRKPIILAEATLAEKKLEKANLLAKPGHTDQELVDKDNEITNAQTALETAITDFNADAAKKNLGETLDLQMKKALIDMDAAEERYNEATKDMDNVRMYMMFGRINKKWNFNVNKPLYVRCKFAGAQTTNVVEVYDHKGDKRFVEQLTTSGDSVSRDGKIVVHPLSSIITNQNWKGGKYDANFVSFIVTIDGPKSLAKNDLDCEMGRAMTENIKSYAGYMSTTGVPKKTAVEFVKGSELVSDLGIDEKKRNDILTDPTKFQVQFGYY